MATMSASFNCSLTPKATVNPQIMGIFGKSTASVKQQPVATLEWSSFYWIQVLILMLVESVAGPHFKLHQSKAMLAWFGCYWRQVLTSVLVGAEAGLHFKRLQHKTISMWSVCS